MIHLQWNLDPALVTILSVTMLVYCAGLLRVKSRATSYWRSASFMFAWLISAATLVSPLRSFAEHLFAAHMIEHEVLMVVAPPLFVLARPQPVFAAALPAQIVAWIKVCFGGRWRRFEKYLGSAFLATALHGAAIWIWHIPTLMDRTAIDQGLHGLQHFCFFVTALHFWWAVLSKPRARFGLGTLQLFATQVHTGLLGALLAITPHVVYPLQTRDSLLFGLTPLQDQQLAGLIMWVPAGIIYLGFEMVILYLWLRASEDRAHSPGLVRE